MGPQNETKNPHEEMKDKIDNYIQTIQALIGFMNFYRYDDDKRITREDVIIFQGWRLDHEIEPGSESAIQYVTPDLGILYAHEQGVLAEAKKSFPRNQENWSDDFKQLMAYDSDLLGWPCEGEKIAQHDIVLLLDQTRGAAIKIFYESKEGTEIKFKRPFIIIQFNRRVNRKHSIFFQIIKGSLSERKLSERLIIGVPVPMDLFIDIYSEIKLYDDRPPLPYLIELIWTNIVLEKAVADPKFEKLKINSKIGVILDVDDIVQELNEGFTFRSVCKMDSVRQQKIPRRAWVADACEELVRIGEAEWIDSERKKVKIFFRKYHDVRDHFINAYLAQVEELKQPKLL